MPKDEYLKLMEESARRLGRTIGAECVPLGAGFIVILCDVVRPPGQGWSTYVSSLERENVPKLLREIADMIEREAAKEGP